MKLRMPIGSRKVAIIGVGYVGATIAYALALRDVAREIVLIDINTEKMNGEAKDIRHGISGMGMVDIYSGDYSDCADCDLIIITAGRGRKSGETRLDLMNENVKIMRNVVNSINKYYTRSVIMLVSNPVDILTQKVAEWMDLPNGMVFGTGCILDTSRFVRSVADYLKLSTGVISGYIVGEHGDTQIPIWSHIMVGGTPIDEFCDNISIEWNNNVKKKLANQTKRMGTEIIKEKGRTHYGIATCVCHLSDAIINQRPVIACVCSPLQGEYGVRNVTLSVPSVIGPAGVQQRIGERWTDEEYRFFFDTAEKMKKMLLRLE